MDDLEQDRWERLLRWLSEQHGMDIGEDAFHVEAREVAGAGRGLFAARECLPSTLLFKVPATALMNKKTVAKLYPQLRAISGVQIVSLHLLLHKPLGSADSQDPTFGPYISTLPRDFSAHPLSVLVLRKIQQADDWQSRILDSFPPSTYSRLSALHDRFWADWKIVADILSENPSIIASSSRLDLTTGFIHAQNNTLLMDYLWAWLNVNTRCIFYRIRSVLSDPDNFTLCPVLDLANHSYERAHIFPVVDSEVWGMTTKKVPKHFLFFGTSQDVISSGQQLYLQYGTHSNSFLFSEYGFVNQVPDGAVTSGAYPGEVDVQDLVEELFDMISLGPRLRSVLEAEGYWGDWTIHSAPTPAHPSYRLTAALRLACAFDHLPVADHAQLEAIVDEWRAVIYGQVDEISPQNEQNWRQVLLRLCGRISERARSHLAAVTSQHEDLPGRGWVAQNVRVLWKEEREVAEAVAASVSAGVEF